LLHKEPSLAAIDREKAVKSMGKAMINRKEKLYLSLKILHLYSFIKRFVRHCAGCSDRFVIIFMQEKNILYLRMKNVTLYVAGSKWNFLKGKPVDIVVSFSIIYGR
jgi:hypothetical protein